MEYIITIFLGGSIIYFLYLIRLGIFKFQYGESLSTLLLVAQETFDRYKSHEFSALILAQNTLSAEQLNEYRTKYISNVLLSLSPTYKRWLLKYFLSNEGLVIFISSIFDQLVRKNDLMRVSTLPTKVNKEE
jgi:hypothetical protein